MPYKLQIVDVERTAKKTKSKEKIYFKKKENGDDGRGQHRLRASVSYSLIKFFQVKTKQHFFRAQCT